MGRPPARARLVGIVLLVHPYPSLLNALLTGALALVAAGSTGGAVRLALAMLLLQASIGALNDLRDAPADAGRKPRKPLPRGLVGKRTARLVVAVAGGGGLLLARTAGDPALFVAVLGLGTGYVYDLGLKGNALSWLPFSVGIPLLPVFAWVGATGVLPGSFLVILPLAAMAGAGIAISNALADMERDREAGVESVATRLGVGRAWAVQSLMLGGVAVLALIASRTVLRIGEGWTEVAATLGMLGGTALILAGIALGRGSAHQRELAWEAQAAGIGIIAVAWLAGAALAGGLSGS